MTLLENPRSVETENTADRSTLWEIPEDFDKNWTGEKYTDLQAASRVITSLESDLVLAFDRELVKAYYIEGDKPVFIELKVIRVKATDGSSDTIIRHRVIEDIDGEVIEYRFSSQIKLAKYLVYRKCNKDTERKSDVS